MRSGSRETVDIYYDYASPFAYLASEVAPRFAEDTGVALQWQPIALEKLSNYAEGLPYSPIKRRYVALDAARSAGFHDVPMRIPKPYPVQSAAAKLDALTAEARGVFGVPSLVLRNELFWGLDSLPVLQWRLQKPGSAQ